MVNGLLERGDSPALLIADNVRTLVDWRELAERAGSYAVLLSGSSEVSKPPAGQGRIPDREILTSLGVYERGCVEHNTPDFTVRTMRGYNDLLRSQPDDYLDAYKFYLSLNLATKENVELGSELYTDMVRRAQDADVAFACKNWPSRAYGALILYTRTPEHTETLGGIIADLYPDYLQAGLFYDTPHFFQGSLDGTSPNHIGWVQEPTYGYGVGSHTQRMGALGAEIDNLSGRNIRSVLTLTAADFIAAACKVFVDPARPYLLNVAS